jgi:hypothetical protein
MSVDQRTRHVPVADAVPEGMLLERLREALVAEAAR